MNVASDDDTEQEALVNLQDALEFYFEYLFDDLHAPEFMQVLDAGLGVHLVAAEFLGCTSLAAGAI
ncbi:hypothetical protein ACFWA5_01965 [Streptomyces mirabilis]|uniref:hypothetical protein n=1 Tax=Streptomyces mirabilis TaxID=68239 RepID=UPI00365DDBCD